MASGVQYAMMILALVKQIQPAEQWATPGLSDTQARVEKISTEVTQWCNGYLSFPRFLSQNSITKQILIELLAPANAPILLDEVECNDSDSSLFECEAQWNHHNCNHGEDVVVECFVQAGTVIRNWSEVLISIKYQTRLSQSVFVCQSSTLGSM